MAQAKKNIFPKLKKSLKNFLTDESWKITKKDALGISAGAALLGVADDVLASHLSGVSHWNWNSSSATYNIGAHYYCNHSSWIVNGHYSGTPSGGGYMEGHVNY